MKVLVVKHLVELRGDLRELAESRNTEELRKRVRTEQQVGAGGVVRGVDLCERPRMGATS